MGKRYLNKSNKVEVIVKLQGYIDKGKAIFHVIIIIIIIIIITIIIIMILTPVSAYVYIPLRIGPSSPFPSSDLFPVCLST